MHKDLHSYLPKLLIDPTKQWWSVYGSTFPKRQLVNHVKDFLETENRNLNNFQEPSSDTNC